MDFLHLIQEFSWHWIQKCISYLNRTIMIVVIVVWNSKNSYFWSASWTPLNISIIIHNKATHFYNNISDSEIQILYLLKKNNFVKMGCLVIENKLGQGSNDVRIWWYQKYCFSWIRDQPGYCYDWHSNVSITKRLNLWWTVQWTAFMTHGLLMGDSWVPSV